MGYKENGKMPTKVQRSIRLDPELMEFLKKNSYNSVNRYIEELILKGLMHDVQTTYSKAISALESTQKEPDYSGIILEIINSEKLVIQSTILVQSCRKVGIAKEFIEDNLTDERLNTDINLLLRFHNVLIVELAIYAGFELDDIREWIKMAKGHFLEDD